jgi:predicted neutral ceramidase superfamily lipid hydrolase
LAGGLLGGAGGQAFRGSAIPRKAFERDQRARAHSAEFQAGAVEKVKTCQDICPLGIRLAAFEPEDYKEDYKASGRLAAPGR